MNLVETSRFSLEFLSRWGRRNCLGHLTVEIRDSSEIRESMIECRVASCE
jgi:hypothetical protein